MSAIIVKGKLVPSSNSGMAYRCASCDEDSCQSCADKGQCVRKWSWRKGWKGKIIDVMENNDVAVKVEWDDGSFSIHLPMIYYVWGDRYQMVPLE